MFYSHEILTSPEHGVATIWLVATLGSRSIARRLNRKAILDVDVPEACRVIVNPEAPMALRLQGSLLYGISRVYNQQCGYTLLDAQAMHDKMISMLKILPGSGLDPSAGKTKPTNLILPYDDTFLPETGLPGIGIDIALLGSLTANSSSRQSTIWTSSPAVSQSSVSQVGTVHLELPSDDIIRDPTYAGLDSDGNISAQKRGLFGDKAGAGLEDEEGFLLQPDFDFDDLGNIVEFDPSRLSPHKRRKLSASPRKSKSLSGARVQKDIEAVETHQETTAFQPDNDWVDVDLDKDNQAQEHELPITNEPQIETQAPDQPGERIRRVHQQKQVKTLNPDSLTSLRNTDLGRWNNEYQANMALASKQKEHNKMPTAAKKNATYWVFGKGIGAVGIGVGVQQEPHPLNWFSGEELLDYLTDETSQGQKRRPNVESDEEEKSRNVRPRVEQENEPMDVEVGRHAPSSVLDDHSSQMPWNITASLQSSRQRPRFGSVSEMSNASRRGRLTSASPLAGRGYLDPHDQSLGLGFDIPVNADDELDELEITRYLEGELAADNGDISMIEDRQSYEEARIRKVLDQESVNFWDFIKDDFEKTLSQSRTFSELLPPKETSRAVATQGFINLLTLATKGAIRVWQDDSGGRGPESWTGDRYEYGAIWLTESGPASRYQNGANVPHERPRSIFES